MRKCTLVLFIVALLTGCVQKSIIDDINIQVGAGFDESGEDEFVGAILVQDYLPDKSIVNKIFTTKGKLRKDLRMNTQKKSDRDIAAGGLLFVIFGDELADKGIINFIDNFKRDPSIGARVYLSTANTSAVEIIKGEYGPQGTSNYLYTLLEHNIEERDVPKTNLHIFFRDYHQKGTDAYLPELKQLSPTEVEISGLSIFKKDKEVDVIPPEKMFFFKLMVDRYSRGSISVKLDNGEWATLRSIKSKHKYKIIKTNPSQVSLDLKIQGSLVEYTGERLTPKLIKEIDKAFEDKVKKECLALIKRFQEKNVDPLGFGKLHRKQVRGFDFKKWEDDYQKLQVKIKADVKIVESGVIE